MGARRVLGRAAATTLVAVCTVASSSCTSTGRQMAGEGATTGAVAGAVGGLLSALIFGGDPAEGAARGAVWGASTGAVAGGMTGDRIDSKREQQRAQQQDADLEKLRAELGDDAFAGLEALADCRHEIALGYARSAARSDDRNHALAGLWLEVLTHADRRDEARARALFPELVAADSHLGSEAQAEETMRETLQSLMDIRAEYGLQRVCPA
jgi:hypothetical protein